ncbi:MAG: aspartate carbamoyltransferase catalytic subunit [Magnetococcales bacterium]|nr:aspartate carbamoyltransferase catalytic subunit [Magnetococcales bacterium]MBF0156404.1 aspartate carbamoyltransferase catalytic subunit [Magnetococcales bacterium]
MIAGNSAWSKKHLLGMEGLTREEIGVILETASSLREVNHRDIKKVPTLRGKTVINLFFENSTRTRTSFELAGKRMSADVINFSVNASSVSKGESLYDTVANLKAMNPDVVVIRHPESGAPQFLAHHLDAAIVNAGDGRHEHPTQSLLDILTIDDNLLRLGRTEFSGLTVAICGDVLHSRVARSNAWGLATMGARVRFVGPPTLIPPHAAEVFGVEVHHDMESGLAGAEVVMMLRLQTERMQGGFLPSTREYFHYWGLDRRRLAMAAPEAIVMHPGPMNRGVEIASDVADDPERAVILDQVANGLAVRMAVLYRLCGGGRKG